MGYRPRRDQDHLATPSSFDGIGHAVNGIRAELQTSLSAVTCRNSGNTEVGQAASGQVGHVDLSQFAHDISGQLGMD